MIQSRYHLFCDHHGCPATFVGPPICFAGSQSEEARALRQAREAGWAIIGPSSARIPIKRHFCPGHSPIPRIGEMPDASGVPEQDRSLS